MLAAGLDAPGVDEQLHAEALRAAGLLTVVRALGGQPERCEHEIGEGRASCRSQLFEPCDEGPLIHGPEPH